MKTAKTYRHLFFDLDRTLWDFDANSHEALKEMFGFLGLQQMGVPAFESFYQAYRSVNDQLWAEYRAGKIQRPYLSLHRFYDTLLTFGIDREALAFDMSERYVKAVAEKTRLFPGALEILAYLRPRYHLHVITNGFADVQYNKLERSGMRTFFDQVITSEEAGAHKPSALIFHYALQKAAARADESLMIGDDPQVDLEGAAAVGIDQMLVNHDRIDPLPHPTYVVDDLWEIKNVL